MSLRWILIELEEILISHIDNASETIRNRMATPKIIAAIVCEPM
jgi:hypothetical protein